MADPGRFVLPNRWAPEAGPDEGPYFDLLGALSGLVPSPGPGDIGLDDQSGVTMGGGGGIQAPKPKPPSVPPSKFEDLETLDVGGSEPGSRMLPEVNTVQEGGGELPMGGHIGINAQDVGGRTFYTSGRDTSEVDRSRGLGGADWLRSSSPLAQALAASPGEYVTSSGPVLHGESGYSDANRLALASLSEPSAPGVHEGLLPFTAGAGNIGTQEAEIEDAARTARLAGLQAAPYEVQAKLQALRYPPQAVAARLEAQGRVEAAKAAAAGALGAARERAGAGLQTFHALQPQVEAWYAPEFKAIQDSTMKPEEKLAALRGLREDLRKNLLAVLLGTLPGHVPGQAVAENPFAAAASFSQDTSR